MSGPTRETITTQLKWHRAELRRIQNECCTLLFPGGSRAEETPELEAALDRLAPRYSNCKKCIARLEEHLKGELNGDHRRTETKAAGSATAQH